MHFWKMQHQTALGDHKCFIIIIIITIIIVIIVVVFVVNTKLHRVVTIVIVVMAIIIINTKQRSYCSSVILSLDKNSFYMHYCQHDHKA